MKSRLLVAAVGVPLLFYIVLGSVLYRGADSRRKPVLKFAVLCPNTNFMGMPVIGSIYGDAGVLLLSIALIPVRVFIMTVGISYFVTGEGRRSWLRVLKNPAVWAVVLGAAMLGLGLRFPEPLNQALSSLGACTTPLSMLLIGGVVSQLNRAMLRDAQVWRFCALRLLLIPLFLLGVLRVLPLEPLTLGVTVTMSALPAGAMTVIYTREYEKDGAFAAECVIFSTLLSILTIPLINLACTCLA